MKECIILAGGFGTRLQSVVKDVPKCMAEVANKPFLAHLFTYLEKQNFNHIVLSLGYLSGVVIDWINNNDYKFDISYVVEKEPLGTGGAIKLAFEKIKTDNAFVINGDTFFNINPNEVEQFHKLKKADISIALKPMLDFDRYGSVNLDSNDKIDKFNEKQYCKKGLINGGVYLINKDFLFSLDLPSKFSFEKDIMEKLIDSAKIYGCIQNGYFIDIGIPSDFEKANNDFTNFKF